MSQPDSSNMSLLRKPDVVIINRNYPPRAGVTGESAGELASYLKNERGIQVSIVTVRSRYAGGGSKLPAVGTITEIGSLYDGKNKLLRLVSSFIESFRMMRKARRLNASQTIVMTDPPFLSFWASLLLGRKRPWMLWAMDLYPEAFLAGQLVSRRNLFYRFLKRTVYRSAPQKLIALGPLQAAYLNDAYSSQLDTALVPCGVFKAQLANALPDWKIRNSDKIILGYCGNLGEAHSPEFLQAIIDQFDPQKFHLVLSIYGAKSSVILDSLDVSMQGITLVPNVPREELGLIDVHLVSLLGRWSHVCVPSKAVSAVCSGASFLFYGIEKCDNWGYLQHSGWLIRETSDESQLSSEVAAWLTQVDRNTVRQRQQHSARIAVQLSDVVATGNKKIADWIDKAR